MANPYHPYQSEANMMNALAANSLRLEEEARRKRNAGNAASMAASLQASRRNVVNYQRREADVNAYLQKAKLEKIKTEGDGNCFFYAVQGYGVIKGIHTLSIPVCHMRLEISQAILADADKHKKDQLYTQSLLLPAIVHAAEIRKCAEIGEGNTWADEIDIRVFSDIFKVCIVIHDWRETNPPPYHVGTISYPNRCYVERIHILRTNNNHYSLLMPIDDPGYIAIKNLVDNVSLPLGLNTVEAQRLQLEQMATQAAANLSRVRLNQHAASATSAPAAASSSALNTAHPFNLSLTPEQLAQQNAILENARKRASQAAASSSSAANRPLGPRGKSAAADVPRNRTNMLAQAASSSSVVQQLVSNASRNLAGVVLNQQSELKAQIEKLNYQIPILKKQIEKLEKSDPKGELNAKKALLKKQEAQLEKRLAMLLAMLPKEGGTRKRRTHKKRTKNNRKSKRKVRK